MQKISDKQWAWIDSALPDEKKRERRFKQAEANPEFRYSIGKRVAKNKARRLESLKQKELVKETVRKIEFDKRAAESKALAQKIKTGNPSKRPRKKKKAEPTIEERLDKLEAVKR